MSQTITVNGLDALLITISPDTTVDQDYIGNLQIGTTYFRWTVEQKVLSQAPPDLTNVSLIEATPAEGDRFTSQSFVASTQVTEGESSLRENIRCSCRWNII